MTHKSVWNAGTDTAARPGLNGDIAADVLIIGAGLAGILTAHKLCRAGVNCVIAEAKTVGSGTTNNSSAKITAQHGLIYADLIERLGIEQAMLYYDINSRALEEFRALSAVVPCDFEEKTAYVYTMESRPKLEREASAYRALGITARIIDDLPLPVTTKGALAMESQAQFNPAKLVKALAADLNIYENTPVTRVVDGAAYTEKGKISAGHIVLATHFPLVNIPGAYFLKLYQHRSYIIALEGAPLPDGMFVDERQNGLSFRTYKNLLFICGGDHRTGKRGGGFAQLRKLARHEYPDATEKYAWAAQDCMTLDGLPYIGYHRTGKEYLYVATGFHKWGMTGSMAAATLLCELILTGKSEAEELFSPSRSILRSQLAANAAAAAAGLLTPGGPRCSHMGCRLHKNSAEGTWDCVCHGSRYDSTGKIIDNPAKRGIHL